MITLMEIKLFIETITLAESVCLNFLTKPMTRSIIWLSLFDVVVHNCLLNLSSRLAFPVNEQVLKEGWSLTCLRIEFFKHCIFYIINNRHKTSKIRLQPQFWVAFAADGFGVQSDKYINTTGFSTSNFTNKGYFNSKINL